MIGRAVITAAGLGTRLLTVTKELPKEMLPVFICNNKIYVKPVLQIIFESLYDYGFREFVFIVSRGKRAIEDHFSSDWEFASYLHDKGKDDLADLLTEFYRKIEESSIVFVNQSEPKGFGDAVYRVKSLIDDEPFLLHAGDDLVVSNDNSHISRLITTFENEEADAVFIVEEVHDPRKYGVIKGNEIDLGIYRVLDIVEKPEVPPSNLAVVAIYVFNGKIFRALENVSPRGDGEIQLTDAIKILVDNGYKVLAVRLTDKEKRLDIGTPSSYWEVLKYTYERCRDR